MYAIDLNLDELLFSFLFFFFHFFFFGGVGWGGVREVVVGGKVRPLRRVFVTRMPPIAFGLFLRVVVLKQTRREVTDADKSQISKLTPLGNMASNL